jgi:hypothetical protein
MDSYPIERRQNWKGYHVPAHSFPMAPDVLSPANFTTYSNLVIPPGSELRARNLSNSSSLSNLSYTSSPVGFDYENNMDFSPALTHMDLDFQHPGTGLSGMPLTSAVEYSLGNRHTPKSLGWTNDTPYAKLYELRVPKGKELYLELLPRWTVTFATPQRVYLDKPEYYSSLAIIFRRLIADTLRNPQKDEFPCRYPGPCPNNKSNVFGRLADLERHYKVVHAPDQIETFPCDYRKCNRSTEPFTRKDHYRDHLRDYHKEDIGSAKTDKMAKNNKEIYANLQRDWLKERYTRPGSWRCGKCLVKVDVKIHGWDCPECKTSCEGDRVKVRQLLAGENGKAEKEETYGESMGMALEQNEYYSYSGPTACSVCEGSEWIEDGYGAWQPCAHAHTQVHYL